MIQNSVPGYASVPAELFIDGAWRPASDAAKFEVDDPADGSVLASVANGSAEDALVAVAAAEAAAAGWAETSPRARGEVLRQAYEIMRQEANRIATLIVRENGKSLSDAVGEVAYAAEFFRWFGEEAVRIEGGLLRSPAGGNHILTMYQPVGVSVLITPWNSPAAMATRKIGPALAAGCPVVLKPAEATPLTALVIADILGRAGVPPGVVNVLTTDRPSMVVGPMLEDERVRKLSFTGSTEVGKLLLAQAARRVVNCSMELGGNAPFVVFEDADLDAAVEGAVVAKMRNGGASCIAANRFLVHGSVAEEFSKGLAVALGSLQVGPGLDTATDVGPLVSRGERDGVSEAVERGVQSGAKIPGLPGP